jgi:hypothetical protein
MKTGKLRITDGKFYRDGVFEKAEFGNLEHIGVLKKNNLLLESYRDDGRLVESCIDEDEDEEDFAKHSLTIDCPCGRNASVEEEGYSDSDDPLDVLGDEVKIKCLCGRVYEATHVQGREYVVRIIQETPRKNFR